MILPETNVIVRPGGLIDAASLDPTLTLTLHGSYSGAHIGRLRLSDDGETLLFQPSVPFLPGEVATCQIAAGIRSLAGDTFTEASFIFTIAEARPAAMLDAIVSMSGNEGLRDSDRDNVLEAASAPGDPPLLRVVTTGATGPGDVFLSDFRFDNPSYPSHLLTVRNDGSLSFFRPLAGQGLDFKRQGDRLTYFDGMAAGYYALNPLHAVVDSFRCGNGYETDPHELVLLPNGHALLMAYDPQRFDMSRVVLGGRADAIVTGLIVQELDREREVVFQWRSWDHFAVTDATHRDLRAATIDYCHGNAIEPDQDGGLLISSRHMDEITKISRATGEIVWRLGGRNNQFAFVGDRQRFSHQHAIRRLPNGNILLFDNGYYHSPQVSRAVEYALDEGRMTATLVWQFRSEPDIFGFAMGNAQRLPNGNTLIGWGSTNPSVTEVTSDGRQVYGLDLPPAVYSYRAFRFEWPPVRPVQAEVHPRVLNTRSGGAWVAAVIEPEAFDPITINPRSITLAGVPAVSDREATSGDFDGDGHRDLTVRFPRSAVVDRLRPGRNLVEIAGSMTTGEHFLGAVEIRLIGPPSPVAGASTTRLLTKPGEWPLRIATGIGGSAVELTAFDVNGRLVRRWSATPGAGGVVEWNGRSAGGERLPSGIYFIRAGREALAGPAARVMLLR